MKPEEAKKLKEFIDEMVETSESEKSVESSKDTKQEIEKEKAEETKKPPEETFKEAISKSIGATKPKELQQSDEKQP